ncbi:MAG: hypothetical protein HOM25_18745 [Rhodospirillaceae bacterium]|jgi:two-component system, cell cycle sensor histidine kinase PleC|nr:hypothetical protein [Rhodospirillaceae bacterium]MBT5664746.1 hypothetical protein [Rhodospirillaceae bacterium]
MPESTAEINARIVASFDALRISVALFDADDVLIYHNDNYRNTYKCFATYESLIGLSFTDLLHIKLEHGEIAGRLALDDPAQWIADRLARRQRPEVGPVEVQLTDGRWIRISERTTEDGDTIGVYRDITQKKKADHQLHDMVAGKQNAFALWNQSESLVLRNSAYVELFGVDGRGPSPGDAFTTVFEAAAKNFDLNGMDAGAWAAARRKAHRLPVSQETVRHRDGRWFLITERRTLDGGVATIVADVTAETEQAAALRDHGQPIANVVNDLEMSKDVLERHSADLVYMIEELAVANSQLEAGNASKTHFLSLVSHELRTPMNAIIGFSEIIKGQVLGPIGNDKYLEYAEDIHGGAQHLLSLVNGLLDMSKIEAGKWELNPVAVDAKAMMASCGRLMRGQAADKSIAIEISCDDPGPVAMVDPKALRQILINLLSNAIKFSRDGGRIDLAARGCDGAVEFSVTDTGFGIPTAEMERILRPFEQLDNDLTRAHEGTGLGLTMCQSLMELHGGSLGIESTEGQGTTVTFSFTQATA